MTLYSLSNGTSFNYLEQP